MKTSCFLMLSLCAAALFPMGCAPQRPVLYPNEHYQAVGEAAARADIDACLNLAAQHGAGDGKGETVARDTTRGAVIGGAVGGAVGAVTGSAGRGAAAGAAGAGAGALTRGALDSGKPDPILKNFVDQCLREKGYQPIGWK
jgi:uncharacterized protein YcfJ